MKVLTTQTTKDSKNPQDLNVKFFDETSGLDSNIVHILNEKVKYLKEIYEHNIEEHLVFQKQLMIDLARYRALTPESYAFMNYTLDEIFMNVKAFESDSEKIWTTLKNTFGKTFFHAQIKQEYSMFFSQKDQELLDKEIQKIKQEAEFNLK